MIFHSREKNQFVEKEKTFLDFFPINMESCMCKIEGLMFRQDRLLCIKNFFGKEY